jgi:Icc-related predicted phosphoesterase
MTKLKFCRVLSDLHLEFAFFTPEYLNTDKDSVLILAGDISTSRDGLSSYLIDEVAEHFKHIIFVLGNHDYYHGNITNAKKLIEKDLKAKGVINCTVIDEPQLVEVDGQKFACGTLWTDFNKNEPLTHMLVGNSLYDFRLIGNGPELFTTQDAFAIFQRTLEKFNEWIDEDTIVVTHHMPSEECVNKRFKGLENYGMNGGFRSSLDELILEKKPKLWIHGHGHDSVDTMIGSTRIIANPRGYPRGFMEVENDTFDAMLRIDIQKL